MLDSLGAFEDMPDWEELADLLFNAGQTVNPSEIHGVMVGLLASDSTRRMIIIWRKPLPPPSALWGSMLPVSLPRQWVA